jgi:mannose-6-phosphate isomerase-like protein (cupin superfamily)
MCPSNLHPAEIEHVRFGRGLGTRRVITVRDTGGAFGLVEHDLPARQLGSPVHIHEREDEYSFVLTGRLSAQLGHDVLHAEAGQMIAKPRGIPHAFWNSESEPVRFLEFISPGGFEEYFFEVAASLNARDMGAMGAIRARYHLTVNPESVAELMERYALAPSF